MINNKNQSMTFRYCTGASSIDFNPFSDAKNLKNHGYLLLLLKPYIDKDNINDGILENYIFNEDENSLEATVSLQATWQDGTPVSSFEAAMGIAKGLTHREFNPYLRVIGTEKINEIGWEKNQYQGIEIISPIKFKIYFEGNIKNFKGVLEDILSFSTVNNIIWPVRLNSSMYPEYNPNQFDIISKYPIRSEKEKYFIKVLGHQVELCTNNEKTNYDFYFNQNDFEKYKSPQELNHNYIEKTSDNEHTFFAVFNSNSRLFATKENRANIATILRNLAFQISEVDNINISPGHFNKTEPGSHIEINWPYKTDKIPKNMSEIKISISYPSIKNKLLNLFEEKMKKNGVKIKWISIFENEKEALHADMHFMMDRVQNNRQIWIQNILKSNFIFHYLKNFPKTLAALHDLTFKSACTLPLNVKSLLLFETFVFDESSIVPIYRYFLKTFTRKNSPIVLNISENKELYFSLNKN
ncbi:hypothetical protein [Silvanigrella aquatica]|uniref:Solute-binding protein family 5 domain-containing protein n=1 Tax=Silvanigrella aquatica TaxID=1915309 RepID=A0A1L4D3G9_9BACT|nr:hypothetical protein [Silvanigrella aquatica]APJ04732.1 hypothetical protein AXG55_12830 [Silvanigrella aquatica]